MTTAITIAIMIPIEVAVLVRLIKATGDRFF